MLKGNKNGLKTLMAFAAALSLCSTPTQTGAEVTQRSVPAKTLQRAINLMYSQPKVAERELKKYKIPEAQAYLAFIYLSAKVQIAHKQKVVDKLMTSAIAHTPPDAMFGFDSDVHHFDTMEKLLQPLRLICEGPGQRNEIEAPSEMCEQYPEAFCQAFAAIQYSSQEAALLTHLKRGDDISKIPQVKLVYDDIAAMLGAHNQTTNGTSVYGMYRNEVLNDLQVSLAPQVFYARSRQASEKAELKSLEQFLTHWSLAELWNHEHYAALQRHMRAAEPALARHFARRFKLSDKKAHEYAQADLKGLCLCRLGSYSHGVLAEEVVSPIYKIFSAGPKSVAEIKERLGARVLTKEELAQALRIEILNGGDIQIIEWLLGSGAPVTGGAEPPLFSSAKRPEVVRSLLQAGADANENNPIGKTALIQAAQYNALETLQLLIAGGADINHKMAPNLEAVHDSDANYICYEIGSRTALMYAAAFGDKRTIEYLLSKGADKSSKDSEGFTAKHFLGWNKGLSKIDRTLLQKLL